MLIWSFICLESDLKTRHKSDLNIISNFGLFYILNIYQTKTMRRPKLDILIWSFAYLESDLKTRYK